MHNLLLILNPLKQLQWNSCKKVFKKMRQKSGVVFYFYSCVKKSLADNFFGVSFLLFFTTDSNLASSFAFYDTHIKSVHKTYFCLFQHLINLKQNADETAQRNEKSDFKNVPQNYILNPFPVGEAQFCSKWSKLLYPTVQRTHPGDISTQPQNVYPSMEKGMTQSAPLLDLHLTVSVLLAPGHVGPHSPH